MKGKEKKEMRREFISGAFGIGAFFLGLYCIAMDERWALALYVFAGSLAIEHAVRKILVQVLPQAQFDSILQTIASPRHLIRASNPLRSSGHLERSRTSFARFLRPTSSSERKRPQPFRDDTLLATRMTGADGPSLLGDRRLIITSADDVVGSVPDLPWNYMIGPTGWCAASA